MPNLDKTGPRGEGSKTGRGRGECVPEADRSVVGQGRGRGCRWSKGLGLGLGKQIKSKKIVSDSKK